MSWSHTLTWLWSLASTQNFAQAYHDIFHYACHTAWSQVRLYLAQSVFSITKHHPHGILYPAAASSHVSDQMMQLCCAMQGLRAPSPFAIGRHGSARTAMATHLWHGYSGDPHLNFTVHVTQVQPASVQTLVHKVLQPSSSFPHCWPPCTPLCCQRDIPCVSFNPLALLLPCHAGPYLILHPTLVPLTTPAPRKSPPLFMPFNPSPVSISTDTFQSSP